MRESNSRDFVKNLVEISSETPMDKELSNFGGKLFSTKVTPPQNQEQSHPNSTKPAERQSTINVTALSKKTKDLTSEQTKAAKSQRNNSHKRKIDKIFEKLHQTGVRQ